MQTENQETRIDAYSENSSCVWRDVVDDGVGARWCRDAYTTWLDLLSLLLDKGSSLQSNSCDVDCPGCNVKLHALLLWECCCVSSEFWTQTNSSRFRTMGLDDDMTDAAVYCKHNMIIINMVLYIWIFFFLDAECS